MTCEKCGETLAIGSYPFCGKGGHVRASTKIVPDDVPGGFVIYNAWKEPRTFYSQSSYLRALDADGMELRPKTSNSWAIVDRQTLENARVMVSRANAIKTTDTASQLETLQMTMRTLGTFTVRAEV